MKKYENYINEKYLEISEVMINEFYLYQGNRILYILEKDHLSATAIMIAWLDSYVIHIESFGNEVINTFECESLNSFYIDNLFNTMRLNKEKINEIDSKFGFNPYETEHYKVWLKQTKREEFNL